METLGASIALPRLLIRLRRTDKGSQVALMRVGGPVGDRENIVDGYFPKVVMLQNDGMHGFGAPVYAGGSPRRERPPLEPGPLSAAASTRSRADFRKSRRKTCKTMGEDIGIEPLTQRTLPKP